MGMEFAELSEDASAQTCDVLVLGAGIAGLAAARALAERGMRPLGLEARDRVGGRMFSLHTSEGIVELGAEFVHGKDKELWALIKEVGAETVERDGTMLRENAAGELTEDRDDEDGGPFDPLAQLADLPRDMSFDEWLGSSDVPKEQQAALRSYVEGFNAADASRISAMSLGLQQRAEERIEGNDHAWHVRGGYSRLTDYLANRLKQLGGEVRLGCVVRSMQWSAGEVTVETSSGVFRAPRCIVSLPLGVLQRVNREGVRMEPEPAAIAQTRRLAMGSAERFTMMFRERWWERSKLVNEKALQTMNFLFTLRRSLPVWWTPYPELQARPTLTGWVGGPRAAKLIGRDAGELGDEACRALGEVFKLPATEIRDALIGTYKHNWQLDPFAYGAYSYVPAGALDAPAAMAEPECGTLFFAGEHTDVTGQWGTVHAALRTGLRAAEQLFSSLTPAR